MLLERKSTTMPLSPAEFTSEVYDVLVSAFPNRKFECDREQCTIVSGDMRFGMMNLHAEFAQASPAISRRQLRDIIVDHFERIFSIVAQQDSLIPHDYASAAERLRPQLVNPTLHDSIEESIVFPFSDDLYAAVVIDAPTGYAYLHNDVAKRWDMSPIDLMEKARDNLQLASSGIQLMQVPGDEGMIALQTNDGYDAARILLPELRTALQQAMKLDESEAVWVGIPNRDFLIAWSPRCSEEFFQRMQQLIEEDHDRQHHPLSKYPFAVTAESIRPVLL